MTGQWTVVVQGDWYLPHLVNMLKEYVGSNGEQRECRDEVVAQIEAQMIPCDDDSIIMTTRPLVVIDPENREQVERFTRSLPNDWNLVQVDDPMLADESADQIAAALREFANPKPDEPLGLGAVVEGSDGVRWVRTHCELDATWREEGFSGVYRSWQAIDVVRVLSEGVTP